MKINYLIILVAIFSLQKIQAQEISNVKLSLGNSAIQLQSQDFIYESRPNFVSIEKYISRSSEIGLSGMFTKTQSVLADGTISSEKKSFSTVDFYLKKHFVSLEKKVNPYFMLGMGISKFNPYADTKWIAGLGIHFSLYKNLGMQLHANYNQQFNLVNTNYQTYNASLVYTIFSKKLQDTDGDGIENKYDKCPEEIGIRNLNGCPEKNNKLVVLDVENESITEKNETLEIAAPDEKTLTETTQEKETKVLETEIIEEEPENEIVQIQTLKPEESIVQNTVETTVSVSNKPSEKISKTPLDDEINKVQAQTIFNIKKEKILKVSTINFNIDNGEISDDEKSKIHMIIYIMDKHPDSKIILEAHASNEGNEKYCFDLANTRAESIKKYLMDKKVSSKKISIRNYGGLRALTLDTSETGKKLNRRVHIILYDN